MRTAVITGATGGAGRALALRLAADGWALALAGRDLDGLEQLAHELPVDAGRVAVDTVDLLDEAATRTWAARVVERFGGVDAVAHLVGGWRGGASIGEADLADWKFLQDALVRTLQHTSRAFLEPLKAGGSGRLVIVSSPQAQRPGATNAAYGAAKAAAEAWTFALAAELAEHGATANVVAVNAILTDAMRAADPEKPYKTFTLAGDLADAIAWLLSDAAQKMNGRRLALHP
ncbi:MAG: SDR family NAD(P)-dependent oxidoreductase [Solirubrobacterales bacterium]|nr:SDR family NAD(P)-dependent oxidoreductase [Solirubrobacterales bacterium]